MINAADTVQTELQQMASVAIKLAESQGAAGPFAILKALHFLRKERPDLSNDQAFTLAYGAWENAAPL